MEHIAGVDDAIWLAGNDIVHGPFEGTLKIDRAGVPSRFGIELV